MPRAGIAGALWCATNGRGMTMLIRLYAAGSAPSVAAAETEDHAAGELELIRVVGIPDDPARRIERVAPEAAGIGLDVSRRPPHSALESDVRVRIHLHAAAPRRREFAESLDLGTAGHERLDARIERAGRVVRRAHAEKRVRPDLRFVVAPVVDQVPVVVVHVLRRDALGRRRVADLERTELACVEEF